MKKTEYRNKVIFCLIASFVVEDLNNLSSALLSAAETCKKILIARGVFEDVHNDKSSKLATNKKVS